jgi:hypothetical protein
MTEPVVSIERIKAQAIAAARIYTTVNDACPYPFGTQAGKVFKEEFMWARTAVLAVDAARETLNLKVAA